jgi:hypothetical protein
MPPAITTRRVLRFVGHAVILVLTAILPFKPLTITFGVIVFIWALVGVIRAVRARRAVPRRDDGDQVLTALKALVAVAFLFSMFSCYQAMAQVRSDFSSVAHDIHSRCQRQGECPSVEELGDISTAAPTHYAGVRRVFFIAWYKPSPSRAEFTLGVGFATDVGMDASGGVTRPLEVKEASG